MRASERARDARCETVRPSGASMKFNLVTFDGVWLGGFRSRSAAERAMKTIQRNCAAINGRGAKAPVKIEERRRRR